VNTEIDHLVIAADTLADGVAWCEATLGVTPAAGGQHAFMGTHNRLLNLSGPAHARCYLEIIAIDPAAPAPARPRWFGLDARRPGPPSLWHVVLRSCALQRDVAGLRALGEDPGTPTAARRESAHGPLSWQITLRDDGSMGHAGALPTLIEWDGPHPAEHLPASGVVLRALSLRGPGPRVAGLLGERGVDWPSDAGPALRALLVGPSGEVELRSVALAAG
jgi:hypothetical protein